MDTPANSSDSTLSPASAELDGLRELRARLKRPLADLPHLRYPLPEAAPQLEILSPPIMFFLGMLAIMGVLVYGAINAPGAVNFAWGQLAILCWTPILIGGGWAAWNAWRYFLYNRKLRQLYRRPAQARGLVFQLWKEGEQREIPCVLFGFMASTPDGKEAQVNISEIIEPEHAGALVVNQPVEVAYLPEEPSICRILYN